MAVLSLINSALDEIILQEAGGRFERLAVAIGKQRWPELIAHQHKRDFGLDAYAPASETPEKVGKGLAASITATLMKVSEDARTGKKNHPDLKRLLFVTPAKVGNTKRRQWQQAIRKDHGLELLLIEREEIITLMTLPENARLCAIHLYLDFDPDPKVADLIQRTGRAAAAVTRNWAARTKEHPLVDLSAVRLDPNGAESSEVLSLEQIDNTLSQGGRIVLEAPAGRGKTTTLIQLAQRVGSTSTPFMVELPSWTTSGHMILEHIAGMPEFQAERLTPADLAKVRRTEPFLFLLNGWNEVTESSSAQADIALRDLERDFPGAAIIVATRTHHLSPPLHGASRMRLLRLDREQRAAYLGARLGVKAAELRARIDADASLDQLTRTPFFLSEVATLFESGADIPSTKIGVLSQAVRLQEQREEHRNPLQAAPIHGQQSDYLKALATEMTQRGAVALSEVDARASVAATIVGLMDNGQIERVGAPTVLAGLTAHHLLERIEYPQSEFRFEHQQFQEYYAALGLRARLIDLPSGDANATARFTAHYVNDPAWTEPLRMIAETFGERTGDEGTQTQNVQAGVNLVNMALAVDRVFAGELARLCGAPVWSQVRSKVVERFRASYAISDANHRQYAIAAMLATGWDDFGDILLPLFSGEDRQARLRTYRLWPDIKLSSLGSDWRDEVRGWSEEARADFVSELLHHRLDDEVASFAVEDSSAAVKRAAASGLIWTGSDDVLTRVLVSMDKHTFEEVSRKRPKDVPPALRPRAIAALRKCVERMSDHPARLRVALDLIELGEAGLDDVLKDAMTALPGPYTRELDPRTIQAALKHLGETDPAWTSEWVTIQIAEGVFYDHEEWLRFATVIPADLVETYLHRFETEDLRNTRLESMITVIAAQADANLAKRVFAKLRELHRKVDAKPDQRHEFEWQSIRQLESLFRGLPDDVVAAGILSCVRNGNPRDITVATNLLSRVARSDMEPLRIADADLKARLRAYLKGSVDLVLGQEDFYGERKADLASSIAQVGEPADMADLVTLIRADIERMRRGWAARAAGDKGPLADGGTVTYAGWHIAAVVHLDPAGAEQVLIDLLPEPEYSRDVAAAMARDFVPKRENPLSQGLRYELMWAAREGRTSPPPDDQRRTRFAAALNAEIGRLREQSQDGEPTARDRELAKALAAIDGRGSAAVVLDAISVPGEWDQYTCLEAAERLLMGGVVMPATIVFALVDSVLVRTKDWISDPDRYLLHRILMLCPFVDNPSAGIAKMREAIGERRLGGEVLREVVTALGESRSDAAIDLLHEFASDTKTFRQFEDNFINAVAALDTPRARELLLGFVEPGIHAIALTPYPHTEDMLVARITELAHRSSDVAARLRRLCERDLPAKNHHILSRIMARLGTPEALVANLKLIDDSKSPSIPRGVWEQLEGAFVEQQSYRQDPSVFTVHAQASNELRSRLFGMAIEDSKRRKSAVSLLGQIETWRLEYGRPTGEPRHPGLASGQPWPLEPL